MTEVDALEILRADGVPNAGLTITEVDDPPWEDSPHWDNWASHVPVGLQNLWPSLTAETRLVAYIMAAKACRASSLRLD